LSNPAPDPEASRASRPAKSAPSRALARLGVGLVDRGMGAAFLVPALLLVFALLVAPFFYTIFLSFTDLSYSTPGHDGNWVGLDNYRRLVSDDPVFWSSVRTTARFVAASVSVEMLLGFAMALVLAAQVRRSRWLMPLLLLPMMLAPVAVGLLWKLVLQGDFGMVAYYLHKLGLIGAETSLLGDPEFALTTMVFIDVWQWTPFVTLVSLAGLLGLPRAPFEAAMMDGAGRWRLFFDVTLPLMRPLLAMILLLRTIDAFKEFDKVFLMTGGGPGTSTELLSLYVYRVNFRNWDLGYGAVCALAVYLVVLLLCKVFYAALGRAARGGDG
jgi:multiple sugar transport system permease protein